mmetsp:Transcript_38232/g.101055  ORF Transcript_38232/g.101055 Transcript_38232/m.101055 type:complete len:476 (+) Transcript_38232:845-2272(+)
MLQVVLIQSRLILVLRIEVRDARPVRVEADEVPDHAVCDELHPFKSQDELNELELVPLVDEDEDDQEDRWNHSRPWNQRQKEEDEPDGVRDLPPNSPVVRQQAVADPGPNAIDALPLVVLLGDVLFSVEHHLEVVEDFLLDLAPQHVHELVLKLLHELRHVGLLPEILQDARYLVDERLHVAVALLFDPDADHLQELVGVGRGRQAVDVHDGLQDLSGHLPVLGEHMKSMFHVFDGRVAQGVRRSHGLERFFFRPLLLFLGGLPLLVLLLLLDLRFARLLELDTLLTPLLPARFALHCLAAHALQPHVAVPARRWHHQHGGFEGVVDAAVRDVHPKGVHDLPQQLVRVPHVERGPAKRRRLSFRLLRTAVEAAAARFVVARAPNVEHRLLDYWQGEDEKRQRQVPVGHLAGEQRVADRGRGNAPVARHEVGQAAEDQHEAEEVVQHEPPDVPPVLLPERHEQGFRPLVVMVDHTQ